MTLQYQLTPTGLEIPAYYGGEEDHRVMARNLWRIDALLSGQAGGIGGGTVENGLLVVQHQGQPYALLPLEGGQLKANIAHRTGLSASLATLSGLDGEISVATDEPALYLHNGVANGARKFRSIAGTPAGSVLLGRSGSDVRTGANDAVALGSNAVAETAGQFIQGSAIPGASMSVYKMASMLIMSAGPRYANAKDMMAASPADATALMKLPRGVHKLRITAMCQDSTNNKVATFTGSGRVFIGPGADFAAAVQHDVAFTLDAGSLGDTTINALVPSFVLHKTDAGGSGFEAFAVKVAGDASRIINWTVVAEVFTFGSVA